MGAPLHHLALATLLAAALSSPAAAQSSTVGIEPYVEYAKRIESAQNLAPLDRGLFGEQTSLYNGSTTFTVVDIDLPGNSALPVRLARTLAVELQPVGDDPGPGYDTRLGGVGNWQVDVPWIAATYPDAMGWNAARCSLGSVPPLSTGGGYFLRSEFWNGLSIHLPGRGQTQALGVIATVPRPATGLTYRLTTAAWPGT